MQHTTTHPLAGQTVTVTPASEVFGHPDTTPFQYTVEDWNDLAFGQSWMDMEGHPASLGYALRAALGHLPLDNEVVYGKDTRGTGHFVHTSEINGGGA